jgi:hypothetical protein
MDSIVNQQVVAYIKYRGEVSMAEIMRQFHVGFSRAHKLLRSLIDEKIIVPVVGLHGTTYRYIERKNRRVDQCLFCNRRACYERVVSSRDNGAAYDEVACLDHIKELHKHSDRLPGVMKHFISSTGKQKRGVPVE